MNSILTSIKKLLGIVEEYTYFDQDLIMHINSVLFILTQLGVGPSEGFLIEDDKATWDDFIGDKTNINSVKSYVGLKVKLLFDPPESSSQIENLNKLMYLVGLLLTKILFSNILHLTILFKKEVFYE